MMKNPYKHTDEALKLLNRQIVKEFKHLKAVLPLDEINSPTREVNGVYRRLWKYSQELFGVMASKTYEDMGGPRIPPPGAKFVEHERGKYAPTAKYVPRSEYDRKRSRTLETILALKAAEETATAIAEELDTSQKYIYRQFKEEADADTFEAIIHAYKHQNIAAVKWVTREDNRVCKECKDRNGEVYLIDNVPPRPHIGCRCYLIPARRPK